MGGFDSPLFLALILPAVPVIMASEAIGRHQSEKQEELADHQAKEEGAIGLDDSGSTSAGAIKRVPSLESKRLRMKLRFSHTPEAYSLRALSYKLRGKYDKALDMCNQAIQKDSNAFVALYVRGWLYDKQGKWDHAIEDFQTCVKLIKTQEQEEGAEKHVISVTLNDRTITIPVRMVEAALGLAYYHNSQYSEADSYFTQILNGKSGSGDASEEPEVYYNRALVRHHPV
jgi:tetratricopeptide (TPR) repeat protein